MSFAQERQDIEDRFKTQWVAGPNTPIEFENIDFTAPVNLPYVRLTIDSAGATPGDIGTAMVRYGGLVIVDIFAPTNAGTNAARVLADAAQAIFKYITLANSAREIRFWPGAFRTLPDSGNFYHCQLTVPFQRDDFT